MAKATTTRKRKTAVKKVDTKKIAPPTPCGEILRITPDIHAKDIPNLKEDIAEMEKKIAKDEGKEHLEEFDRTFSQADDLDDDNELKYEPSLLYRCPGSHRGPYGVVYDYKGANNKSEKASLLKDGWFLTIEAAATAAGPDSFEVNYKKKMKKQTNKYKFGLPSKS